MKNFLVLLCLLVAAPLQAQTIPVDFHAWFLAQVVGKPFSQQTLLDLGTVLPCVGSGLTPPNAGGERTKIWEPNEHAWRRVGFGDHEPPEQPTWVWKATTPGPPPEPRVCGTPPAPTPVPAPQPSVLINYALIQQLVRDEIQRVYDQHERTYADEIKRFDSVASHVATVDGKVTALDQKTTGALKVIGDSLVFVGKYIAPAVGAWIAAKNIHLGN